ncbi:MAG TPA: DUF3343 domain-containing protein [Chloroflexi bacterium]|jgi:uncharacterized SAM-binding protein YcdF (DUF218 family)|nr:DUF3343 domain-containing protein [Chloroflexota bacterium]
MPDVPPNTPVHGVVLVPSVSHSLRAEKVLSQAGFQVKLIPTPRQLSSDCGTAIRFPWAARDAVQRALDDAGLAYDRIVALR